MYAVLVEKAWHVWKKAGHFGKKPDILANYLLGKFSSLRMRSSLVVRASDCQCTCCNGPGFDPGIRRHSGIWGAADEAVLNIVWTKHKKSPKKIKKKPSWQIGQVLAVLRKCRGFSGNARLFPKIPGLNYFFKARDVLIHLKMLKTKQCEQTAKKSAIIGKILERHVTTKTWQICKELGNFMQPRKKSGESHHVFSRGSSYSLKLCPLKPCCRLGLYLSGKLFV